VKSLQIFGLSKLQ